METPSLSCFYSESSEQEANGEDNEVSLTIFPRKKFDKSEGDELSKNGFRFPTVTSYFPGNQGITVSCPYGRRDVAVRRNRILPSGLRRTTRGLSFYCNVNVTFTSVGKSTLPLFSRGNRIMRGDSGRRCVFGEPFLQINRRVRR